MMFEKDAPIRASDFFSSENYQVYLDPLIGELKRLNIIEEKIDTRYTTNRMTYTLTHEARTAVKFMPDRFNGNPYGYFLMRNPNLSTTKIVIATPNKKNNENNKTSWYNSSLFINFLLPLLVGLILLAIAIFLKKYYNLG